MKEMPRGPYQFRVGLREIKNTSKR